MMAGALGAVLLWIIQMVMHSAGQGQPPLGTAVAGKMLGMEGSAATVVGALLFVLSGAIWGAIYAALVPRINWKTGLLFSLVPWLFVMFVMLPLLGKPVFAGGDAKGILMPLMLNAIWGVVTGALTPSLATRRAAV